MKSVPSAALVSIAAVLVLASSAASASGRSNLMTAVSRGSHVQLTGDLVIPANVSQFPLDSVHSRQWTGHGGVVWCSLNLRESSLDTRQISAGRRVEFSGVVLAQGEVTYAEDPRVAYRIELEVSSPVAIRSVECSGARYDNLVQGWAALGALVEDLAQSFAPFGDLILAEPREVPGALH